MGKVNYYKHNIIEASLFVLLFDLFYILSLRARAKISYGILIIFYYK